MAKKIIFFIGIILFAAPSFVLADERGQKVSFFIDSSFDAQQRTKITATLITISPLAYFYIDEDWWNSLNYQLQQEVKESLQSLSREFEFKIYPTLTSTFGSEWTPGIDDDAHLTVLIHPMKKEAGGYFNNGDGYSKLQNPKSNEREMVYLSANYITDSLIKTFLAHEFLHLITFSQKEKIHGISEEIWLNEARSEYASTLLDYDDVYQGSNIQRRIQNFINNPSDSITEWKFQNSDYGALNLFTQYLVDHYGVKILADSLKSKKVGIPSLNEALSANGFKEDFSQVFTNWTVAVFLNDCSLGEKYCYLNKNLRNFQVTPQTNLLPLIGESTLTMTDRTKDWTGNWYKFIGGKGILKIELIGSPKIPIRVPYLTKDSSDKYSLGFFQFDESQRGEISISDFGTKIASVIIIPSIQSKISGFNGNEIFHPFSWSASIVKGEKESIEGLLAQIDFLQKEIARIQAQIQAILAKKGTNPISCQKLENNLYFGMRDNAEVLCLQKFLKSQGSEIYPEGLITGNFLSLTRAAVIRFQEKYASEILTPLSLERGTGFVGDKTRAKINEILRSY